MGLEFFSIKSSAKNLTATESQSWCFVAGTLVATETGYKAIEEIEVGDTVLAENPETGEVAYKTVLETYQNETTELVHVYVNGETISATPSHPFYVNQFGWTRAADLRAGDVLVLSNGEYVVVEFIQHEILEEPVKVYNFEVEDFHTYFVGEVSVLVHNMCTPKKSNDSVQEINNKFPDDGQVGRQFDYTIDNGRIHIENGIQNADFIIDMDGNLKLGRGHSYLANGGNVQAAGTIKVNSQGRIRLITNESGHFQPTVSEALNYPTAFGNIGLDVNNSWIRIGEFTTSKSNYVIDSRIYYNGPVQYIPY